MFASILILIDLCVTNCSIAQLADLSYARPQVQKIFSDLSFGGRQVEQIICDQPDMGEIIKREPVLRLMLLWYFAGELTGPRVYWDCREPTSRPADHLPALSGYPALIRVSRKSGSSAVDKCTMLLFELLNSEIDKEYQSLLSAPVENRKSRDDFATSCVRLEFSASQKTKLFFLKHPLAKANFKNDPNYTGLIASQGDFAVYLRWLDGLDSKAYNPLKYYRQVYDALLPAPARQAQ